MNNSNLNNEKNSFFEEEYINEALVSNSKIKPINNLIEIAKQVCKIYANDKTGTGFLMKLKKNKKPLYSLMTCAHVIDSFLIKNNDEIEFYYDNEKKNVKIKLNKSERFIKDYTYMGIDNIIIEILKDDKINEKYFLSPNLDYINNYNELKTMSICILQYPGQSSLSHSEGDIIEVNDNKNEILYTSSTNKGSSGSPIFLENTKYVIGIHKQGESKKERNKGNLLYPIIKSLNDEEREYKIKKYNNNEIYKGEFKNNLREGYGTINFGNNIFYTGQWSNDKKNGKGYYYRKYYCKGKEKYKTIYEGEYVNDMKQGKGKYYYENGKYYIGTFINDLFFGKGKLFYPNDSLNYKGEFAEGYFDGEGVLINEYGDIFEGTFKKGLMKEGILYYPNKAIKYIGSFFDNKYNGEGILYDENGDYYEGKFENGQKCYEGKEFYKNEKLKYKGYFLNNKYEGEGKLFNKDGGLIYDGEFINGKKDGYGKAYDEANHLKYEGEFKNGLKHGIGKEYDSKEYKLEYEGNFFEGKHEGKGKIFYENGNIYYDGEFKSGLKHGNGKEYYENGNIKYEGNFFEDKYEGNGKYYWENGYHYEGPFSKGKKHGVGKIYNKSGHFKIEEFNMDSYKTFDLYKFKLLFH